MSTISVMKLLHVCRAAAGAGFEPSDEQFADRLVQSIVRIALSVSYRVIECSGERMLKLSTSGCVEESQLSRSLHSVAEVSAGRFFGE
jgi:hypothetical protein